MAEPAMRRGDLLAARGVGLGALACGAALPPTRAARRRVQTTPPGVTLVDGFHAFEELRVRKSDDELERMRRAIAITEDAWATTFDALEVGMTEADVSRRINDELDKRGISEGGALVQSGANAALP